MANYSDSKWQGYVTVNGNLERLHLSNLHPQYNCMKILDAEPSTLAQIRRQT